MGGMDACMQVGIDSMVCYIPMRGGGGIEETAAAGPEPPRAVIMQVD